MRAFRIAAKCFRWSLALSILLGSVATSPAAWLTIHNDFFQIDQNGDSIHTRSGCIRKFNNTYYWYGSANGFSNQTCYSSTDLMHWTYNGVAIKASGTNRVDVLYNDSTKQYVMFLKYAASASPNPSGGNNLAFATSSTPTGPFTLKSDSLVFGSEIGDMSVFEDTNRKAYVLFVWDSLPNANSGSITNHGIALLTPDYLHLAQKTFIWDTGWREAPCMMQRNGLYYYLSSRTMGIQSTATMYYTAPSPAGPWTIKLLPLITPGSTNSWDTQINKIFTLQGSQGTVYVYIGDRWQKPNEMRQGDYPLLPITFSPKDSPIVNYYQDWEVDPIAGTWRQFDIHRDLALHKIATASSTIGTYAASGVTDSTTYLNFTSHRWESAARDTQWIRVDLGSPTTMNRVILKWDSCYAKAFQVQVSNDTSTWSSVYSSTNLITPRTVTDQTFPAATARYVRMYATARGTTHGYALFSFMVLNDSGTTPTTFQTGKTAIPSGALLTCKNSTIYYSIPSGNFVKLDIMDGRGKLVAVLVDGFKQAGDHEAVLPGTLGHGMYIIRLTTGAEKLAKMQVRL